MLYQEIVQDPETEFNELLRMELGWGDVAKGLTQVLFGYCTLVLGTVVGCGLIALAIFSSVSDNLGKIKVRPSNTSLWQLYIGLGILSLIGLISYGMIIRGQFRCLMHAPERNGARWFMFMCIACLFLGPAFHVASQIANWQMLQEIKANPGKLQDFKMNPLGHWLLLIGFAISMLYPLCFTLFLRSVGVCLRMANHVMAVNVFLGVGTLVAVATMFLMFKPPLAAAHVPIVLALCVVGGWLIVGLAYFALIAATRIGIVAVTSNVKSPLQTWNPEAAHA